MRTLFLLALLCSFADARDLMTHSDREWSWRGSVARGRSLEIKGVTGDIRAGVTAGPDVEVKANVAPGPQDAPVELRVSHSPAGVTVCAIRKGLNACAEDPLTGPGVRVDFEVRLPAGVHLVAQTVNGGIQADSLQSDVNASTVNGAVDISTSGTAKARTVNGSIRASLLKPFWRKPPEFFAVNGGISVKIPHNIRTDVKAETKNGRIVSDVRGFSGAATEQTLDGVIGGSGAGHPLVLRTINGTIELHQRF